jgi:hypothetical protein
MLPQPKEDLSFRPLLEAAMGGTTGADARLVQRIPLAAGAEHEENGIHRLAIINAGPMTPQRVRFARGEEGLDTFPQLVRDPPITADFFRVVTHHVHSCGKGFLPTGYYKNSLLG